MIIYNTVLSEININIVRILKSCVIINQCSSVFKIIFWDKEYLSTLIRLCEIQTNI